MTARFALFGLVLAAISLPLKADPTLLLTQPALSKDHLAFVYAGDIWVADLDGSHPRRLTSHPAEENTPVFSPDGSMIAFDAEYDGNQDVYVISVAGGQPRRLTWNPSGDRVLDWTADGKQVAFASNRETDHGRSGQLYFVSAEGGAPVKQMEARIYRGAFNAQGDFAYIAFGSGYNGLFGGTAGWRGYRGGTTPAIQVMNAARDSVYTIPGAGATNFNPMWIGGDLYFLSDRDDKRFQVFHYNPASKAIDRISNEDHWDVRSAGANGSMIVYEAGGRLKRLNPATGEANELAIEIAPDLPQRLPQWKDASRTIDSAEISKTGKRAVLTARGEVFTVPVKDGSVRNLSNSGSSHEYSALWSPDGLQLAWIRETGKGMGKTQEVVVANQQGKVRKTYPLGPHFYSLLAWGAGDTPRLLYLDNHLGLHALELKDGKEELIATGKRRDVVDVAVSPDGAWLAYTEEQANYHRDLMLLEFATGQKVRVSDGMADAAEPAFSPDGKYLYFAASTNSGPLQVGLNMTSQEKPFRAGLYAVVLAADGDSPLKPPTGDEAAEDKQADKADKGKKDKQDKDEAKEEAVTTRIDVKGLQGRIVALPVAERNYGKLGVGKDGKLFYISYYQPGTEVEPPGKNQAEENTIWRFDFEKREESTVLTGVNNFSISSDGAHMIISRADGSLATAEIADEMKPEALDLSGVKVFVDPAEEWAQIFDEAWRMEKEFFYAPNLHGLDWDAVYQQYRPLLAYAGRREDVSALIVEMIAELQVGHNRTGGGDVYSGEGPKAGLLGANLVIDQGRYRLARVYTGESWNPFVEAPLAQPGSEAHEGEYILAVNGQDLHATDNLFALLQGTAGQQVTLRVGPNADGKGARDIVVKPTDNERLLRRWHWIETNRRLVDEATGGKVGYIYLPDTADAGYTYFNRMFFPQVDKQALIIDERSNSGGQAANYIIEVLGRKHLSGWADRDGLIYNTPAGEMQGPKLMMIDQDAGSGGDYLPYTFRSAGIGKLLGRRTWGGLIGIYANPQLMDGGTLTVPFFRFFDAQGHWDVENKGVAPDIDVALDPIATNQGVDSQLQAAIGEIQNELKGFVNPVPTKAPPLPTHLGE